jgi:hypothetical protein
MYLGCVTVIRSFTPAGSAFDFLKTEKQQDRGP